MLCEGKSALESISNLSPVPGQSLTGDVPEFCEVLHRIIDNCIFIHFQVTQSLFRTTHL